MYKLREPGKGPSMTGGLGGVVGETAFGDETRVREKHLLLILVAKRSFE